MWTGVELVEPKVVDAGPDFALGPKNSGPADHVLEGAGPMGVGAEPGQLPVPIDSNWLEAVPEVLLGLLASKAADIGLELVMEAMQRQVAVAAEAELRPKVVKLHLVLGPVARLDVEPDAVVAEPRMAVAVILAEPVEPREVVLGIFAVVGAPMMADAECRFVMAVPKRPGPAPALALEAYPKLVAFAVVVAAHENVSRMAEPVAEAVVALEAGPRMAEHVSGLVLALEVDSMMAESEGSKYLRGFEAVLGSEKFDMSPKMAVLGTDLEVVPGVALELNARNG